MKLVDPQGNEVTSKKNEKANKLEQQLSKKAEKVIEPILNKVKLSGSQLPQEQLMQLVSMAHSSLFNRFVYNLAAKMGIEDLDDIVTDSDVEELQTNLKNQIKMVDQEEMKRQQQQQGNQPNPDPSKK